MRLLQEAIERWRRFDMRLERFARDCVSGWCENAKSAVYAKRYLRDVRRRSRSAADASDRRELLVHICVLFHTVGVSPE